MKSGLFPFGLKKMNKADAINVMRQNANAMLMLMEKHYINKIELYFPQEHSEIFTNKNYSAWGLADINFFVTLKDDSSAADLSLFSNSLSDILQYDFTLFSYSSLIKTFVAKSKELHVPPNKTEELYKKILKQTEVLIEVTNSFYNKSTS